MKMLQNNWKGSFNFIFRKLKERKGLAQIPLMVGLLIVAAAIPFATNLVQQNQENRSSAVNTCSSAGGACMGRSSGLTSWDKCPSGYDDIGNFDDCKNLSNNGTPQKCCRSSSSKSCKYNGAEIVSGKSHCVTVNPNDVFNKRDKVVTCNNGSISETPCSAGQVCKLSSAGVGSCSGTIDINPGATTSYDCNRCSNNIGCARATFKSNTSDCANPISGTTPTYTTDQSCPRVTTSGADNSRCTTSGGTPADKACAGKTGTVQVCVVDYLYTCINGKPTNSSPAPTYCPNSCDAATNKCKSSGGSSSLPGVGETCEGTGKCINTGSVILNANDTCSVNGGSNNGKIVTDKCSGGTNIRCCVPSAKVNGKCNPVVSLDSAPTTATGCDAGTIDNITENKTESPSGSSLPPSGWKWTCKGSGAGATNAECFALKKCNTGFHASGTTCVADTPVDACKKPGAGTLGKCGNGADCGTETCFCWSGDAGNIDNIGDSTTRTCTPTNKCTTKNGKCEDGTLCGQTNSKGEKCTCVNANGGSDFTIVRTDRTCNLISNSATEKTYFYFAKSEISLTDGTKVPAGTCHGTSGKYATKELCETSLGANLSNLTSGVCYESVEECNNANADSCYTCSNGQKRAKGSPDAECNGAVNELDFAAWLSEYQKKIKTKADFNCSGSVGIDDFTTWNNIFRNQL